MLPAHVQRADGGPTEMVFVQASDGDPLAEAQWVDDLDWPELMAIVAGADLTAAPEAIEAHLNALARIPRVVGVRHLLQDVDPADFPAFRAGLEILARHGGTFDACVRHPQLPALVDLLAGIPDLVVVLDHLGKPPVDEGIDSASGRRWSDDLGTLADRPHMYVKLSGLSPESSDSATFDAHSPAFIDRALEAFGPERAMVGSDWPVSAHFGVGGTFRDWADRVRRRVGDADWPAVVSTTARSAYLPGGRSGFRAG
jgi:L-fuconolactonase